MIGQSTPLPEPGQASPPDREVAVPPAPEPAPAPEFGGRDGPEPTRYGDWEKNGRCIDF